MNYFVYYFSKKFVRQRRRQIQTYDSTDTYTIRQTVQQKFHEPLQAAYDVHSILYEKMH